MATRSKGADPSAQAKRPAPFWQRLNTFFTFPLQSKPLMYSLLLALSSMLFKVIVFLPDALGILIVEIGILLAASRYGFKVTALGSRGIYKAEDYPSELDPDWKNLPWKLFAILMVQGFVVGWLQNLSPTLGTLAWLGVCFLLPATQIVLVQTCSFIETLNPANAWNAVRTIGWPYLLLSTGCSSISAGSWPACWATPCTKTTRRLALTCCPAQGWTKTPPPWTAAPRARLSKTPSTPRWPSWSPQAT